MQVYITFITDQGDVDAQNYYTGPFNMSSGYSTISEGSWVAIPIKAKEITGIILEFYSITSSARAQNATCDVSIMDQSSGGQFVHGTLTNVAIDRHTTETIIFNKPYNLKDSSTFIELPFSIDIN